MEAVEELTDLQKTQKIARNQSIDASQKAQLNKFETVIAKLSKTNKSLRSKIRKEQQKKVALENINIDQLNKMKELEDQVQQTLNNNRVVQTEARIEMKENARKNSQIKQEYEERQRENRKIYENRIRYMEM